MIEGAVHHLDILADLAGAECDRIYAETWIPPWGEYAGDSQGLVTMHFKNGVRAFYEGAKTNAVGLNGWSNEYIRAECRDAIPNIGRIKSAESHINVESLQFKTIRRISPQDNVQDHLHHWSL